MRHPKRSQKSQWLNDSDYLDSESLKGFEVYLLKKFTLLKTIPLFRSYRLGRAIAAWNREE